MYHDLFTNNEDIVREFHAPDGALDGATVLLAWYRYEDYSGSALVVFEKDGKLWEVNGNHCSCNGLEDQWQPEETSWEALSIRNFYLDALIQEALDKLCAEHIGQFNNKNLDAGVPNG